MKTKMTRVIAALLCLIMTLGILAGCQSGPDGDTNASETSNGPKPTLNVDGVGNDKYADYSVSGTVTIAVDTARATDYEALFDYMEVLFPNLEIQFDYFSHTTEDNAAEYLATRAAAGKLPDIVWDEAGMLPLYLTQGWLYPLDEFVKDDPDFAYIPENLIEDYTYGGKLYALPNHAHYELMYVNLDLLDELNLDMPELDWTIDDFTDYLKAATTAKTSGIEMLFQIPDLLVSAFDPNTSKYGYNFTTHQLEIEGYTKAVQYMVGLRQIPGLEAWSLKSNVSGDTTDYFKKFGTNAWTGAFDKGLTLFHGVGTWELASAMKRWEGRNWTYWTIPQSEDNPGCMPLHVDHCFMTSSCQNPEAAWQVLRYLTYSVEGNLARLSMYDEENEGLYDLNNLLYYPTTLHPDVAEKFKSLPGVDDIDIYLFENICNSTRTDMVKLVPSWNEIYDRYIAEGVNTATDGTVTMVEATLKEMANQANQAFKEAWESFDKKLAEVQKEFDEKHSS